MLLWQLISLINSHQKHLCSFPHHSYQLICPFPKSFLVLTWHFPSASPLSEDVEETFWRAWRQWSRCENRWSCKKIDFLIFLEFLKNLKKTIKNMFFFHSNSFRKILLSVISLITYLSGSNVTKEPKCLPQMQCQSGPYSLSKASFRWRAMSCSRW